jgi:hypothetical protein
MPMLQYPLDRPKTARRMSAMKRLRVLLIVALTVGVIFAVGGGLLYAVRPTPELGGQPEKFTIGTAIIVAGYLLFNRLWPRDPNSPLYAVRADHRGEHLNEVEAALRARG